MKRLIRRHSEHSEESQRCFTFVQHDERNGGGKKIKSQNFVGFQKRNGATEVTRTPDLLITNQLLYRLSHGSTIGAGV